jgi:hypothetical protein
VDWNLIKTEYIAGGTSYRKLCEKYGVSRTTLQRKAKDEQWCKLRSQAEAKAETKIVDRVSNQQASTANKIVNVADKLLDKISVIIDRVDKPIEIKDLSVAIKNIKDIKGIKSDIDLREQEARIRSLEKQLEKTDDDTQIVITFGNEEAERFAQ